MNGKWKKGLLILAGVLIAAVWLWRFRSVNKFYQNLNNTTVEIYGISEEVPFEDDYVEIKEPANGYTLRVDDFKIVDYSEFVSSQHIKLAEEGIAPEKLALIYLTLRNIDSTDPGVMLSDLKLIGIDQYAPLDWDLLSQLNPVLETGYGIALSQGASYQVIMPYQIYRISFSAAWSKLNEYEFLFQMTSFPTRKLIRVQGE